MNLKSPFELEAGKPNLSRESKRMGSEKFIHTYKISAKTLLDICQMYPQFERFLQLRATSRRAHFKSVFNDVKNIIELQKKQENRKSLPTEFDHD